MMKERQIKKNIENRVNAIVNYIIKNKTTIRQTAKVFGVSKSTIHKDLSDRLDLLHDMSKIEKVYLILNFNKEQRHIRGGLATQMKYKFKN